MVELAANPESALIYFILVAIYIVRKVASSGTSWKSKSGRVEAVELRIIASY